jgi:hypothetical protein
MTARGPCEISWFSALCDDDDEFLGIPDSRLQSSFEHCGDIVLQAGSGGLDNVLLHWAYALGIDTTAFAAAMAPLLRRMRMRMAVRIGESRPPQLARQIATIDPMLGAGGGGLARLAINIISSDLPGETLASGPRYARTLEAMTILRTLLDGKPLDHRGEFWQLTLDPSRVTTVSGRCPSLYFGGLSEAAREAAAQGCDVYLMSPDTMNGVRAIVADLGSRAARHGRSLRFGYRVHVVVRETKPRPAPPPTGCCRSSTATPARQSAPARSTRNPPACAVRPSCARKRHGRRVMPRPICGPASVVPARAAARRSSAIPTRCSRSCTPIATRRSMPSSCRATPTPPKPTCSPATSSRASITRR